MTIKPSKDDFVYFDPPYFPIKKNLEVIKYNYEGFNINDQIKLRDFIVKLNDLGIKIMLSNSKSSFIEKLYSDTIFNIEMIDSKHSMLRKDNMEDVKELIIRNYK